MCGELRGSRKEDTDVFQKQCIDGLNWVIEVYNRVSDMVDAKEMHMAKEEMNQHLTALGGAIQRKDDGKMADILENAVVPFLKDLEKAMKKTMEE